MQVASLELCKELHDLSGWNFNVRSDRDLFWYTSPPPNQVGGVWSRSQIRGSSTGVPAYDLGYLFRKLETVLEKHEIWNGISRLESSWEDRAAQLAIQLFKQNILTPENE